jgi:amino acid adenylation domain-containing protein
MRDEDMQSMKVEGFRISPQQKRLWSLQQADPTTPYRAQCVIAIKGNIYAETLKAALQNVVSRFEILRTTFQCHDKAAVPDQVINEAELVMIQHADLSEIENQEQQARIETLYQETAQVAFDFDRGPLLHTKLVKLSLHNHLLMVALPALCADRQAIENLMRELSACCEAIITGEQSASEPMQYADLAEWQNEMLEMEESEVGRRYWTRNLNSSLLAMDLPFKKASHQRTGFKPKVLNIAINADAVTAMAGLVEKQNISEYTFLLACLQALIWRITNEAEGVVGAAYDCRRSSEIKDAIGLFAKYLPIPFNLQPGLKLTELLRHVDEAVVEASRWQEFFSWDAFEASRDEIAAPLFFPICFDYERRPVEIFAVGISFALCRSMNCIDRFKVKVHCIHESGSLFVELHYDENSVSPDEASRFAGWFKSLVESAVINPDAEIAQLEILSKNERAQLLYAWNETAARYATDKCLHQLVEEQVQRAQENVAVLFEGRQMTYAELNARANQLAHRLIRMGVGPETVVGICLDRSIEMIVGLLAILKAGGAYLPLDTVLPYERLSFMLEDARVPVLLTVERLLPQLPSHLADVICLDAGWNDFAEESEENPLSPVCPDNLAYVIYTSGSTGKPKGVLITHANVTRLLDATHDWFLFNEQDVWTMFHSYAFDFSVWEIWGALVYGGKLVVVPHWISRTPDAFYELLCEQSVTVLNQTPSAFRQLIVAEQAADVEEGLKLRLVIFGGEALELQSLRPWLARHADDTPRLVNMYGITETTVHVTYEQLSSKLIEESHGSLIGRRIPDLQVYVLDQHFNPVPVGVSGELHVGGAGLARGYLNRSELTAERFIPDPFSSEPGMRLYRTGDEGRFLADGRLEYMGRIDQQVKIRGYRIELGEIEAALREHEKIEEAVVIARAEESGDKRLIAYVVTGEEAGPSVSEMMEFMRERLPEYMAPSAIVKMERMPLTANGKVDRRALPAPEESRPELNTEYVEPRTPAEEIIANIWAELLMRERVGIHDNFFDLGGHSLLATRIVSHVREAYKVEIPLRWFFTEGPTVAKLAEEIERFLIDQAEPQDLASALDELSQLSDEEVRSLLSFEEVPMSNEPQAGSVHTDDHL